MARNSTSGWENPIDKTSRCFSDTSIIACYKSAHDPSTPHCDTMWQLQKYSRDHQDWQEYSCGHQKYCWDLSCILYYYNIIKGSISSLKHPSWISRTQLNNKILIQQAIKVLLILSVVLTTVFYVLTQALHYLSQSEVKFYGASECCAAFVSLPHQPYYVYENG